MTLANFGGFGVGDYSGLLQGLTIRNLIETTNIKTSEINRMIFKSPNI
jgi:hypothetical protein